MEGRLNIEGMDPLLPGLLCLAVEVGGEYLEVLDVVRCWGSACFMVHVGPRWGGEAAALEHHENPSQPVLGFIRSLAGCGVVEGSPGPAVLCNTFLLVNSGITAISAQLPPEQNSDSPYSPFPSLLLSFPHVPGSSLVRQQCHCVSPSPAHLWYWCYAGEALRE